MAPTYKATHEFVSGIPGKDLPQGVKALLPADQTDLKDGSQATPTQPSKTEEPQAVLEYGKATLTWFEFDFRRV
ncbi:hypothetical protein V470_11085 [Streptococcus sp. VT 162]|nr:hypothetical protein V470_11085 [Streptococcus sp. VT 162]